MEAEEVSSDEDVYEVEKIVDNLNVGGRTYYRVRWKNYGEDGDTWEPRENLLSCEDLLNNYIRIQTEKATGLNLPSDVFTAALNESDSEHTKKEKPEPKKIQQAKKKTRGKLKKTEKFLKQDSESSSGSSSDEPHVKDPFWEKLKEGKIDVFATDLYSKVKQRRPPEKEVDTPQQIIPPEISGRGKKRGPKKKADKQEEGAEMKEDEVMMKEDEKNEEKGEEEAKATKRITRQNDSDRFKNEKNISQVDDLILEDEMESSNTKEQPNLVLQYLENEIKNKKDKKKQKEKEGKLTQKFGKEKNSSRSILDEINVDTNAGDGILLPKICEMVQPGSDSIENFASPNIVLEKIDLIEKDLSLPEMKEKELDESPGAKEKEVKRKKGSRRTRNNDDVSESEKAGDSEKSGDGKGKVKLTKERTASAYDAFSVQLQESDAAATDLMLKKKEKAKKHKSLARITPPTPEKHSQAPSTSGASVFEMLTQEMEKTVVTMTNSNPDSNMSPFDTAVKDAHDKLGLKPPNALLSLEEPKKTQLSPSCSPDMVEFLKIKVNFELDEISVKDIERHHEMGEPGCRLERDITNAEFRQYIRSNNFEMVHEALKSKKMMYNLEHTDSVWMTQLMVAAAAGFDEIVKILAHHGARVNARTKIGQTALMFAAEKGHDVVCRILIAYGTYMNLQTTSGETALMKAAKSGHTMIVRYLLQAGADPTLKSSHGTTALEIAERGTHVSLSGLIKDHETNINAHVNECIHRECHSLGIRTIGLPVLAPRLYNIRETPLVHITFNCVVQNVPPNQGLMVFAVHGMIGSGLSIKCRMRGPCHVQAVTLNNFVMDPAMPGNKASEECTHYMTNIIWRGGQNSLRLFVSQDALSNEKLFVSIFQCGFAD